jgi:tetratricopeptide (TPR) repeat protein
MDFEDLMKKGKDLRDKGKYEESLKIYKSVLEKCPNYVPALIGKGVALRGLKIYDEALIAFNKAIAIGSESTEELTKAWNNKGFVFRDLKEYDEALKAFNTSIYVDRNNAFSWNAKGLVLLNLQKYDEAIEAYTISAVCRKFCKFKVKFLYTEQNSVLLLRDF